MEHNTLLKKSFERLLSGNMRQVILELCAHPAETDLAYLSEAICLDNYKYIITVLCTRSTAELNKISELFKESEEPKFSPFLNDLTELSRILQSTLFRPENEDKGLEHARKAAQKLYENYTAKSSECLEVFHEIFLETSFQSLALISEEYTKLTKSDISEVIRKVIDDEQTQEYYLLLLLLAKNKPLCLAKTLHGALEDDRMIRRVIHVIVSQHSDLYQVKKAFHDKFHKTIVQWLGEKLTNEDPLKKVLLALLGENRLASKYVRCVYES